MLTYVLARRVAGDPVHAALVPLVEAARLSGRLVVFSGLRFPTGYEGLSARHRLFGGLARLNAKLGDKAAHWFMEGFSGSELCLAPRAGEDAVVWRTTHLPLGREQPAQLLLLP